MGVGEGERTCDKGGGHAQNREDSHHIYIYIYIYSSTAPVKKLLDLFTYDSPLISRIRLNDFYGMSNRIGFILCQEVRESPSLFVCIYISCVFVREGFFA